MSVTTFTVYPYSRGHVHITGPSLDDPVDFTTGFFTDPIDVTKHVWVYKKQREIARRMQAYRGEVPALHPPFARDSAAALIIDPLDGPLADVSDIRYTAEDDAVIAQWARDNVGTTWHSLGTCNMAPLAEGGVVDGTLSVHGLEGLKIADLSIAPENVAANTAATALAIGEKAADIILKELGY
jgi:alcohol oxidase